MSKLPESNEDTSVDPSHGTPPPHTTMGESVWHHRPCPSPAVCHPAPHRQ